MIHLEFEGMCKGCEVAELELEALEFDTFIGATHEWFVHCIHENACKEMQEKTMAQAQRMVSKR